MKKKLLAMLLAVVMVCGVAGCGKDKTDATDGQQVTAELDGGMLLPQAKRMKLSFASSPKMTAQCWIP